ncbi:hypothetical protein LJK87_36100 [Paenibacillus sp. P25]|nr:hypothetical protein LJK87_36100 [Paenibacillus sp. P25]
MADVQNGHPMEGRAQFYFYPNYQVCPSLPLKRWIYRHVLGMKVGEHASFALMVMVDVFFPERIEVGRIRLSDTTRPY